MNSYPVIRPYKGLRPYEEKDRDNFFGREAECRILIDKILANKLTLLFAASGVGKSSLLQAAVLPHLKDPRYENRDAVYYNDWVSPPLEGLKEHILQVLQQQGILENIALPDDLHAQSLKDFFGFCALFTRQPLVVVLDQFEEFFQYQRYTAEFKPFIQELAVAITDRDTPIAVVISMREDFALELNAFKSSLPLLLFENFYRLERFDRANAKQAIEEPVQRVGFRYEPELLESLLKDLAAREQREHTAIPVAEWLDTVEPAYLQIVCSQLWEFEKDNTDRLLRLQTYRDKGSATGILKNYVDSIIGGFTPGDKKLASKAFDHLITRRGTKMAYTAGDLAQLLGVNTEALGKVLDRLEKGRILRRQSRQGVFWYELYHDLFSKPIEEWNEVYKAKQRNKRAFMLAGSIVMAGLALYGAYDTAINYTSFHLRLSAKRGISDAVELYQGKEGSHDFLGQQRYLDETGYQRAQIEPDKLFESKAVGDSDELNWELIGNLPLVERIKAYWQDGQTKKALPLAKDSISEDDIRRSQEVIKELAGFYSPLAIQVLVEKLEHVRNDDLKVNIIETLGTVRARGTLDSWLKFKDDSNPKIREAVVNGLVQLGDPRAVEPLLQRLADADAGVRWTAADALGRLGDPRAVEPLLQRLGDKDEYVRWTAADALGRLGGARAVEPLLQRLADADKNVRRAAADALARLGDARAVESLLQRLGDKDEYVRRAAAEALGQLSDPRAVESLLQRLADADATVRIAATKALGQLGDARAVESLLQRLTDADVIVCRAAAEALGQLGDARAVEPLLQRLTDADAGVRQAAAGALEQLGDAGAVEPLLQRLADADAVVRQAAANALAQLGDARAVGPLLQRLADADKDVRQAAANALGQLGDARAVEPLLQRLADPNEYFLVRRAAADALGRLADARAVEPLLQRLADADAFVRQAAANALAQLGDGHAVEPLLQRLADANWQVIWADAVALGQLGDARAVEPLLQRLDDPNEYVRRAAADALAQLGVGDAHAVEPLLKRLKDTDETVRQEALLALGKFGDAQILDAVAAVLQEPTEERIVKLVAAVVLLKFNREDGLPLLKDFVSSNNSYDRKQAAEVLGAFPTQAGNELLLALLKDRNLQVKQSAIRSLSQIQATNALSELYKLLKDPSVNTQLAAAEGLGQIASTDSIPVLHTAFLDTQTAIPVRLATLTALKNIGTDDSIQIILEAVEKDEKIFGLRVYNLLGELGEKARRQALPQLSDRLAQLEDKYRDWRRIRDAERPDFSKEETEKWAKQLKAAEPQRYWAFPLAQAIARIDPNGKGFELLSHDLADVRAGAWTGLSQVGDVKLLEKLHAKRLASKEPLFRHAAYRAIDLLLLRLGGSTHPQDLTDLQDFYEQVKDEEGVGTRVEWTVSRLKERLQ